MVGTRFFSGSREGKKDSLAREILRIEREKGGKLTSQERFQLIMKRKMADHKKLAEEANGGSRQMSKSAQNALKQVAAKKAAKEAKILRQSVIVQKKIYSNGMVTRNGKIMDIAGNQVGTINKKNGKMSTTNGTGLGQYKPNSRSVNSVIMGAIDKYSPYFINLRKMQEMQAAGLDPRTGRPLNENVIDVHGNSSHGAMHGAGYSTAASQMFMQQHQEHSTSMSFGPTYTDVDVHVGGRPVAGTAWGAMSENVWGTFSDNVWGTTGDNVWGTASTDVWGGVGQNPWAGRSVRMWGTGDGVNRLKKVGNMLRALFGKPHKQTLKAFQQFRKSGGAGATVRGAKAPSRPAPAPQAPRGRR